jgi:ribosomal protein S18 acetylase RimI-like enzyme
MVEPEPTVRYQNTRVIVSKAKELAKKSDSGFLTIKTWHDTAILRGLIDEGFQMAEIGARFSGPLNDESDHHEVLAKISGVSVRRAKNYEWSGWFDSFGDLFYDGHLLHGPFLGPEFQSQLWREVAVTDMRRGQPFVFLWQDRPEKPIGLAWGGLNGPEGDLVAIHVVEERRGQGLGAYLAGALMKRMYLMGARELTAETASWNLPAIRLYQSLGLNQIAPLVALHLKL